MKTIRRIGHRRSHTIPAFFEPELMCPIPLEEIAKYQCLARRAAHPLGRIFHLPFGQNRPFLIAFVGRSGTGKSTVAREWAKALGNATVVEQDSTLLEQALRPGPSLVHKYDFDLANEITVALLQFQSFTYKPYSPVTHLRGKESVTLMPTAVVLVEGVLALEIPTVRMMADIKVYVECDPDLAFERQWRRAKRDGRYDDLSDEQLAKRILDKRIDEDPIIEAQRPLCQLIVNTNSSPATVQPLTCEPNPHRIFHSLGSPIDVSALPIGAPN